MNWKNITLEQGFVRQEINVKGSRAVSYIPLEQVDSFGVVSSENKRWLYASAFVGLCALVSFFSKEFQVGAFITLFSLALAGVYFLTRQTWFSITSSQTKFSVQVSTTKEEIMAVDLFVSKIKENIKQNPAHPLSQVA